MENKTAQSLKQSLAECTGIPLEELTARDPAGIIKQAGDILRGNWPPLPPMTEREELLNWARWCWNMPDAITPASIRRAVTQEIRERAGLDE